jgi:hypothetical protein
MVVQQARMESLFYYFGVEEQIPEHHLPRPNQSLWGSFQLCAGTLEGLLQSDGATLG